MNSRLARCGVRRAAVRRSAARQTNVPGGRREGGARVVRLYTCVPAMTWYADELKRRRDDRYTHVHKLWRHCGTRRRVRIELYTGVQVMYVSVQTRKEGAEAEEARSGESLSSCQSGVARNESGLSRVQFKLGRKHSLPLWLEYMCSAL
jgi:hypothetical protein